MRSNASAKALPFVHARHLAVAAALGLGLACAAGAMPSQASAGTVVSSISDDTVASLKAGEAVGSTSQTITVTGRDSVFVEPDVADLSFAIEATGPDAANAVEQAGALAASVNDALVQAGVDEQSIQTAGVSVSPRYTYDEQGNESVSDYYASVRYEVGGIAVDEVGEVLGAAIDGGVTRVDSIAYYSSSYDEQYQQALIKATDQARDKAWALAEAQSSESARAVVVVSAITESPSAQQYRYADAGIYEEAATMDSAAGASSSKVSSAVVPGLIEIEAEVTLDCTVTFAPDGEGVEYVDEPSASDAQDADGPTEGAQA